jgi:nitroreductase
MNNRVKANFCRFHFSFIFFSPHTFPPENTCICITTAIILPANAFLEMQEYPGDVVLSQHTLTVEVKMKEDVLDFILKRQSCRDYKSDPLKEGDLEHLMDALRWAPSAGNSQAWFFYVVTKQEAKEGLGRAAFGQSFIADAPVVFVVCANADESSRSYGERGRDLYCLQDTAAATENLLLAATTLGYGSCWIGAFQEQGVSSVLNIPNHLRPVAMVPVGYARSKGQRPGRKKVKEIFEFIE